MRADVGFGALDRRSPRGDCPLAPLPNWMTRLHAWQGTSARETSKLADLPDRTGKTDREAAIFYQIQDDLESGGNGEPDSTRGGSTLGRCHVGMFAGLGKADCWVLRTREHEPWFRARVR